MSGLRNTVLGELEEGVEVVVENFFTENVDTGVVEDVVYASDEEVYRVELDSRKVYTVTGDPESYDHNLYVAVPEGFSVIE